MLHVKNARYTSGFKFWVSFDDGSSGEVDLTNILKGSMFEPLNNPQFFSKLSVDPELETVVWPNGADLAPEFLKSHITRQSSTD